jgi:hypothetical protein
MARAFLTMLVFTSAMLLDTSSAAFLFGRIQRLAARKALTSLRAQEKPGITGFSSTPGREAVQKSVNVRVDSFHFRPAYVPAEAMNDVQVRQ